MKLKLLLGTGLGLLTVIGLAACGGGGSSTGGSGSTSVPSTPPVASFAPTISSASQASISENETTSFYTLTASDPDGDPITMSLASSPDASAFSFDAATGQLSPASPLDYETPLDSNEDNIYNLTFSVADDLGNATQFNVDVSVDDIRDAFEFGLDPNGKPADNFELIDWRLDFPLNSQGQLTGQQEAPSERELVGIEDANPGLGSTSASGEGFEHPLYFHTGADGGLVMRAPVIGATTSSGVRFTRTEFREMLRRGDENIRTNTNSTTERPNLNNFAFSSQPQDAQDEAGGVDGTLRVTMAVNAVTTTGQNNEVGRLIIGQIHARNDEPLRLYYRKLPGNTHGSIYACHEIRDGDDITFNILGSIGDNQPNPTEGFLLGEIFTYEIVARGNFIDVIISQDGVVVGDVTIDQTNSGYDIGSEYFYFKAGNYHVNSTADPSEYAEVTLYELENSHQGYNF